MECRVLEPQKVTKIGLKTRVGLQIGVKIVVFDLGKNMTFGSRYRKVRNLEGLRNWDYNVFFFYNRKRYFVLIGDENVSQEMKIYLLCNIWLFS